VLTHEQGTNVGVLSRAERLWLALAGYPHVTTCGICRAYAEDHVGAQDRPTLVAATLSYHESCHRRDLFQLVSRF